MNSFSWKQRNRDWPLILTIFLAGIVLMFLTGTLAIGLSPQWTVQASMDSKLDPNAQYVTLKGTQMIVEPVMAAILTPATWQALYLTPPQVTATRRPGENPTATSNHQTTKTPVVKTVTPATTPLGGTVTPTSRVTGTRTSQVTPSQTSWIIITPSSTPKPNTSTPKPAITHTPSITLAFTKTFTPTKTLTPAKTITSTRTSTPTITRTYTPTITPTWTNSLTPTFTFTPTVTASWTNSLTPTETFTPTITLTPTQTFTPIPTSSLINLGPGDGNAVTVPDGTVLNFTLSSPIYDHGDASEDFVYYEKYADWPTNSYVALDRVRIEISQDGTTWYTVFFWGDNIPDINTNVTYVPGEIDNEPIYSGLIVPPYGGSGTGIGIDVSAFPPGNYFYLRIGAISGGGNDGIDVDAIYIYP